MSFPRGGNVLDSYQGTAGVDSYQGTVALHRCQGTNLGFLSGTASIRIRAPLYRCRKLDSYQGTALAVPQTS